MNVSYLEKRVKGLEKEVLSLKKQNLSWDVKFKKFKDHIKLITRQINAFTATFSEPHVDHLPINDGSPEGEIPTANDNSTSRKHKKKRKCLTTDEAQPDYTAVEFASWDEERFTDEVPVWEEDEFTEGQIQPPMNNVASSQHKKKKHKRVTTDKVQPDCTPVEFGYYWDEEPWMEDVGLPVGDEFAENQIQLLKNNDASSQHKKKKHKLLETVEETIVPQNRDNTDRSKQRKKKYNDSNEVFEASSSSNMVKINEGTPAYSLQDANCFLRKSEEYVLLHKPLVTDEETIAPVAHSGEKIDRFERRKKKYNENNDCHEFVKVNEEIPEETSAVPDYSLQDKKLIPVKSKEDALLYTQLAKRLFSKSKSQLTPTAEGKSEHFDRNESNDIESENCVIPLSHNTDTEPPPNVALTKTTVPRQNMLESHHIDRAQATKNENTGENGISMNPPFECTKCWNIYTTKDELDVHCLEHTTRKIYKCLKCNDSFERDIELIKHDRERHQKFKCKHCGKTFATSSGLKRHEKIHEKKIEDEKSEPKKNEDRSFFSCIVCTKQFEEVTELRDHLLTHEGSESTHESCPRFECLTCSKVFGQKDTLIRHCIQYDHVSTSL